MAAWGLLEFPLYVAAQIRHADANTTMRRLHAAYPGEELPVATPLLPREPVPEGTDA